MNRMICIIQRPVLLAVSTYSALAQGTIHVNFGSLSPGEVLGEQFAASGVHFVPHTVSFHRQ
jgi:hypothetical protein